MRWPLTLLGALALASPLPDHAAGPSAARAAERATDRGGDAAPRGLPAPVREGGVALNEALQHRRSVRGFDPGALPLADLAQLLWAAQGVTSPEGGRTVPSAGATYPLNVYVVAENVEGTAPGTYRYRPAEHDLVLQRPGGARASLAKAAYQQDWVAGAPAILVLAADYGRTTQKYGQRGSRYVEMEAGAAAQSVHLTAIALGLGTTPVGAFDDKGVAGALKLPREMAPLLILPVGAPAPAGPR